MKLLRLMPLLVLVCLVCAKIELSVKATTKDINAVCHPGVGPVDSIFRYWRVCLPDNQCVRIKHRIGGNRLSVNLSGRSVIMLTLPPIKPSDVTFAATIIYGNISTGNISAISVTLACGVTRSGGLIWSNPVQISPQITRDPLTKNKISNPGPTNPDNTSRPSGSDAITAFPAKYMMSVCIVMAAVLMWGLT